MSTLRTASLFGRTPLRLGPALESLLTELYKAWYTLPPKSTVRHIETWRERLRPHFADSADEAARNQMLIDFTDDLVNMTGVTETAGTNLAAVQSALKEPEASLTPEELEKLTEMLSAETPGIYAIQQMHYVPATAQALYAEVQQIMVEATPNLTPELQTQLATIWANQAVALKAAGPTFESITQVYVDALTELEQIPRVVQLTHHLLIAKKVNDINDIKTHRGAGSGIGQAIGRGAKSPFESMGGGALESFPPAASDAGEDFAMSPPEMAASEESPPELVLEESSDQGITTHFSPDVRFPERVKVQDEVPLIVQFSLEQHVESRVTGARFGVEFADVKAPEYVEVVLNAPGFEERTGIWSRTMTVYADQDSQPAIFLLRGKEQGEQQLTISFYHRGRHLGQVKVSSTISDRSTSGETSLTLDQATAIMTPTSTATPPADLELRIIQGSDKSRLSFMLHSSKGRVGYHWRPVGEITLAQSDPQKYLEYKFERMSQLAGELHKNSSEADVRKTMQEIETIGEELFEDLFPEKLKDEYWKRIKPLREKGIIESFLITSDEPWIPWEMVKPYRHDEIEDIEESDGFLCQSFQFCRWLAGTSPAEEVTIKKVMTVVPRLDLAFAAKEQDYLATLNVHGVTIEGPLKSRDQVLDSVRNGGFEVLHFAAHGQFIAQQVNRSPLVLENNEELLPEDLSIRQVVGLRRSKPIVFLNACHTSRINFALNGLGGWAEKMVQDAGVSAFIGTLWEVDDELALAFSTDFYEQLSQNQPLGRAFSHAREHTRALSPANPTWLAYTLYGDPNSRITWGE